MKNEVEFDQLKDSLLVEGENKITRDKMEVQKDKGKKGVGDIKEISKELEQKKESPYKYYSLVHLWLS